MNSDEDNSCSSDDSAVAFAFMDFEGVDFGEENDEESSEVKFQNIAAEAKAEQAEPKVQNEKLVADVKSKVTTISKNVHTGDGVNATIGSTPPMNAVKTEMSAELATVVFDRIIGSEQVDLDQDSKTAVEEERHILFSNCFLDGKESEDAPSSETAVSDVVQRIRELSALLAQGHYIDILNGSTAQELFNCDKGNVENFMTVPQRIRHCVLNYCSSVAKCVEVELLAVASLNIFMQCNYTGPALHHGGVSRPGKEESTYEMLSMVNPHPIFACHLNVNPKIETVLDDKHKEPPVDASFQNAVLAELSADGEWPCPVCKYPYFLLLARVILSTLANPNRPDWTHFIVNEGENDDKIIIRQNDSGSSFFEQPSESFVSISQNLACAPIWCGRAIVAHSRLLQGDEPSMTLWREANEIFNVCLIKYCNVVEKEADSSVDERSLACKVLLEYGLAEHHFGREKLGKPFFRRALGLSDLDVEVTGAEGKRTKFQQKATAQMLVRAKPIVKAGEGDKSIINKEKVGKQEIKFEEDNVLLDKVKYEEEGDNIHFKLSILQQTVLLALCLDVKNDNPMDGLTGEQMGAYLERVLQEHDDWMVYATGLLERAWLQSEGNHTRERALLQLQALADQHTNRLTLTQSTFQAAVEDSAPPQERLRNIHYIVHPPRWEALRDLAERYARIGIVTSAAEIFEEIELLDEVVECYRRAGKEKKAEEIVRKRLAERETPRMWAALGDITGDKSHYEKALEVSSGRYSSAYVALGKYYSDRGELEKAVEHFKKAVHIRPLTPQVWFRIGTLSMRLEDWETALQAFTQVVVQEAEESDAWANIAAIHMRNKNPEEAFPALNEVSIEW